MGHLESINFHDAYVYSLMFNWTKKEVSIHLNIILSKGMDAVDRELVFKGVSSFQATHKAPWGPSSYINNMEIMDEHASIEMQSGDKMDFQFLSHSLEETHFIKTS